MKKLQTLLLMGLSFMLCVAATGCGQDQEDAPVSMVEPIEIIDPVQEGNQNEVPEEAEEETLPDTPPSEGMVRSRLTNEWVDEEVAMTRPIAVMVPNSKTASHYGLSQASILYECNVEGSMTRLMGVWEDWGNLEQIGNIRSSRDYYIYWAFEWDAIYIHFGGPFYIDELISRKDTQNINCLTYSDASFRASAKNSTDNAFTGAEYINNAIEYFDYPTTYRDGYADDNHYKFAPASAANTLEQYPDGIAAETIDLSPAYPVTNSYFKYNASTGLYERFQHLAGASDGPHIDMANDEQLTFTNVLIQNTYFEERDGNGYLAFRCHDNTRDGWFFTNGRGIHVTWEKSSDYGATRYYDDDGNEIELNTGKTMVCIVEDGDSFLIDGTKMS